MGTRKVRLQIMEGKDEQTIRSTWDTDLEHYRKIRSNYLLYP